MDYIKVFSDLASRHPLRQLQAASVRVHEKYYAEKVLPLEGYIEHLAYSLFRFPATYQAILKALSHMKETLPSFSPRSVLDLGSGPGTGLCAAKQLFPELQKGIGLERNKEFLDISKNLFSEFPGFSMKKVDLEDDWHEEPCDLMIVAYSFSEFSEDARQKLLKKAEKLCRILLLVEPGTPRGYEILMQARDLLIKQKALILAPCPHASTCPFLGTKTWCHESIRLKRTGLHRILKGGSLGYEDEKFSYLAVSFDPNEPTQVPPCRIVHSPRHRGGHTYLSLCTKRGKIEEHIIARKKKELYTLAKHSIWGDSFPDPVLESQE